MMKIEKEIANQEVEKWLDFKKIDSATREANQESINKLANAIADGFLVLKEDNHHFVYSLKFPIEGDEAITSLEFKARMNMREAHGRIQNIKPNDGMGMLFGYAAALTNKPVEVIKKLDSVDNSVVQAITVFFT